MGTERKGASLSGATAAEYEVNHSPEAGESSQWAAVSVLYISVCVCTNSQIQVFRRVWLYKFALIIPASCVWRAKIFAREYSGAAVFRKISLFKSAPFQILSSWHKKEKKKKRAFKAAAFLWKYMFESWTTEMGFCSLFKCKETILLASVPHWVQKTTSDVHIWYPIDHRAVICSSRTQSNLLYLPYLALKFRMGGVFPPKPHFRA